MTQDHVMVEMWKSLLADRKAERRRTYVKYAILGGIAISYAALFLFAKVQTSETVGLPDKYASLVRLSGQIAPGGDINANAVNPVLEKAFSDPKSVGVVLLVNSPGGTPVQSALIHDRIQQLKERHKKKVVVVGEDMLTSGAYLIAVAGDEIVVNRSTLAGSIGVISQSFGFTGLMDKLGVERRVMTAGESKNMLDPFSPPSPDGLLKQAKLLESIHTHFIETVKEGRGARLKLDTPGLFSGTVWTGAESIEYGLVDSLGDVKSATQKTFGVSALREFRQPMSFLDIVVGGIGTKVAQELKPKVESPQLLAP